MIAKLPSCGAAVLALVLTAGATAGAQPSERQIGKTVLVEPRVTRQGLEETEEALEVGSRVLYEDEYRGDDKTSRALLVITEPFDAGIYLNGQSRMRLTPSAILSTDHCRTDEAASRMFAIEAEGSLRFLVENMEGCDLEVHTDRAVVFIQGSDVRLWARPEFTLVAVVEGTVRVRARDDRGELGAPVVVTAGYSTLVREGGPPTFPATFEPGAPPAPPGAEPPYEEPPGLPADPALPVPRLLPPLGLAEGPP